ncbi:MAG: hypothetical protein LBF87_05850 [Treponema sp.]|nr:hypothetical protein [Treponema sp.]
MKLWVKQEHKSFKLGATGHSGCLLPMLLLLVFSCSRSSPPAAPVAPTSGTAVQILEVTSEPLVAPPASPLASALESVPEPLVEQTPELAPAPVLPDWPQPLAIIKSGEHPLWFELIDGVSETGLDGIRLFTAPANAALNDFVPWPLARNVSAMLLQDERLVLAINREGFLVAQAAPPAMPQVADVALYRIADRTYWDKYTVDALFLFEGKPTALLYRDSFFIEPTANVPEPRSFALIPGNTRPLGLEVPTFSSFPAIEDWDLDSFRQGSDGAWYFRGLQQNRSKIQYFRAQSLLMPAQTVSLGAFMNSANPEPLVAAPPILGAALEAAFTRSGSAKLNIAAIISPDFAYPRHFSSSSDNIENLVELSGYMTDNIAVALLSDGWGVVACIDDKSIRITPFSLPALPKGFVYTGIGPVGDSALAVSWEEQQDLGIGAAGFMLIKTPEF